MPQPRKYTDVAERQRAYRARKKTVAAAPSTGTPGYSKWRKELREASDTINRVYEEMHYWIQERSERWQESDRGASMEADRDELWEISDKLNDLGIWTKNS